MLAPIGLDGFRSGVDRATAPPLRDAGRASVARSEPPSDLVDLKRLEQQRALQQEQARKTDRTREDAQKVRQAADERRARREAAAVLPDDAPESDDPKKRARLLMASIDATSGNVPNARGGASSTRADASVLAPFRSF